MAEEALDGTIIEESGESQGYEPGQGQEQEQPETLESLKSRLEESNRKQQERAAQANAHWRELKETRAQVAALKAERDNEKAARFREESRRLQAYRAEVYADAPDYVVDLATQLDGLKQQLQGDPEQDAQLDQQEQEVEYVAETLEEAHAVLQRDPETWDAFATLIAAEKNAVREQALLTGNYLSEDEINDYVGRQSAKVMADWRKNGVQIDTGIKYIAWNRGWRPPEQQQQPAQGQRPQQPQKSPSQNRLNAQRETQNRRQSLSGPSSVGATGRQAMDFSALGEDEWFEARMNGTITDAQAAAYEHSLLGS